MALTVLVSLAVAITLVPALMAILGKALFWPRGIDGEAARGAAEPARALRHGEARSRS